jgi:hypothetical protein
VEGTHYERTANCWLDRMDANREPVMKVLADTYGAANAPIWFQRCVASSESSIAGAHRALRIVRGRLRPQLHETHRARAGGRSASIHGRLVRHRAHPVLRGAQRLRCRRVVRVEARRPDSDHLPYLDPGYTETIIARDARDYAWIMARTPRISDEAFAADVERLEGMGYDTSKLRRVPQQAR